jgi:NAD(P)-dependent dehydrogenase (short-subunit alcohol dehydrogenase family)
MLDLTDRVFLISGASRGIGLAIAAALHGKGCRVSLGTRSGAVPGAFPFSGDPERIHALVNNAGAGSRLSLREVDEPELDRIWAVNCKAPLSMIRAALPHLEASGAGRIVNVASMSGKRVRNDHVAYNMSKFAVVALTHAVRRIGWEKGVRATALCPSFVRTDMTAGSTKVAAAEMTDPQDLAALVTTIVALPNTASVAELLVNCRLEDMV